MSNTVKREIVIVVVGLTAGFCLTFFTLPRQTAKVYDCSIAEISPDIPIKAKEECRRLRSENIK